VFDVQAVAVLAMAVLLLSNFPPLGSELIEDDTKPDDGGEATEEAETQ
jgi:hypothetical protein